MSKSGMEHFILQPAPAVAALPGPAEVGARLAGKIVIRWYRRETYGVEREYVHPADRGQGEIIQQLTGKRTIDGCVRELLRDLTGAQIEWIEVIAP